MDERQFPEEVALRQDVQIDEPYMKNRSPIDLQISSVQMNDLSEKCDIQMSKVTSQVISDLFQEKHPTEITSTDFSEVQLSDVPTLPNRRPSASYYGRLLTFTEELLSDNNPRANSQNLTQFHQPYPTIEKIPLDIEIRRDETITNYKYNIEADETLKAEEMNLSFGNVEEKTHSPLSNTGTLKNKSTNEISGEEREVKGEIINDVCVDTIRHNISPPVKPIDMTEFLLDDYLVDTKLDSPVSLIDPSIISSAIVELNRPLENNNFKEAIETGELTDSAFFSHNKRNNESNYATCVSYLDMPVIEVDNSLETSKKIMVGYPSPLETLLDYSSAGPNYQSNRVMNEERPIELKIRSSFEEPNTNNDIIHVTDTQVDIHFPLITPLEHRQPSNQDRQDMLRMQRRTSPDILRALQQMNINYIEDTPINFQNTIYPQNSNVPSIESTRKGSVDAKPVQVSESPLLPTTAKNRPSDSNVFDTIREVDDDPFSLL